MARCFFDRLRRWWLPPIAESLDEAEWRYQHDRVSTTLQRAMWLTLGYSLFCLLTLGSPDRPLFEKNAITIPFANTAVSYSAFLFVGPGILLGLAAYLQIYLARWCALRATRKSESPPTVFNLAGAAPQLLAGLLFYWVPPLVVWAFAYRAAPHPQGRWLFVLAALLSLLLLRLQLHPHLPEARHSGHRLILGLSRFAMGVLLAFAMLQSSFSTPILGRRVDLHEASLAKRDLRDFDLHRANLSGADLAGADLSGSWLLEADLRGANLAGTNLSRAFLGDAVLEGAILRDATLYVTGLPRASLKAANLERANLESALLDQSDLRKVSARRAAFPGADLRRADLRGADLREADLSDADLSGPNVHNTNLLGADLRGAFLREVVAFDPPLSETRLAKWRDPEMQVRVIVTKSVVFSVSNRDPRWAYVLQDQLLDEGAVANAPSGVNLGNAKLRGADLTKAVLRGAALQGADLEDAKLEGAELTLADLRQVRHLSCAQLTRGRNWERAYRDPELACDAPIPRALDSAASR